MIGNSLLTQVLVAGVAIGIIITFIQPTLKDIGVRQDEIEKTRKELANITAVNQRLAALYVQVNAIPQSDQAALFTFLPDQVDEVQVLKDLSIMTSEADVFVNNLNYDGGTEFVGGESSIEKPYAHSFSLNFLSSYEQMKNLLLRLEQNNYPLTVNSLSVSPNEGGLLDVSLTLHTYSHKNRE
jgi:hypothetical protein